MALWEELRNEDPPKVDCSYGTFTRMIRDYCVERENNTEIYDVFPKTVEDGDVDMEEVYLSVKPSFDSSKIVLTDENGVSSFCNIVLF